MKHQVIKTLILGSALCTFSSCDVKQKMDDMHENTKKMAKITEGMAGTTVEMSGTTKEMAKTTNGMAKTTGEMAITTQGMAVKTEDLRATSFEMYDAMKQGDSSNGRRMAFQEIWKADSSGSKLTEAAKYFAAFEFQLYSGIAQDQSEEKKLHLMEDATAEFFKSVKEFYVADEAVNPTAQAKDGAVANKQASFNAIAAALHEVNRKQKELLEKNHVKEEERISMLKMITESLKQKSAIDSGQISYTEVPAHVRNVLENEEIALQLLQARHNFILTIFLSESTDITKSKLNAVKMSVMKWDLDLSKRSLPDLKKFSRYLKAVSEARQALKAVGTAPVVDSSLNRIFGKSQLAGVETKDNSPLSKARSEVKALFDSLVTKN